MPKEAKITCRKCHGVIATVKPVELPMDGAPIQVPQPAARELLDDLAGHMFDAHPDAFRKDVPMADLYDGLENIHLAVRL